MNGRELTAYESFVRVARLVRRHPALLELTANATAFANLEAVIAAMEEADKNVLVSASQAEALDAQIEQAADALKLLLSALVAAAEMAGIQGRKTRKIFREPTVDDDPRTRIVIARAAAEVAVAYEEPLKSNGCPPAFIAELRQGADDLEMLLGQLTDVKSAKTGASDDLPNLVKKGRTMVGLLESQLAPGLAGGLRLEFVKAKALGRSHRGPAGPALMPPAEQVALPEAPVVPLLTTKASETRTTTGWFQSYVVRIKAWIRPQKKAEVIEDAEYTIEEIKRLPPPR